MSVDVTFKNILMVVKTLTGGVEEILTKFLVFRMMGKKNIRWYEVTLGMQKVAVW